MLFQIINVALEMEFAMDLHIMIYSEVRQTHVLSFSKAYIFASMLMIHKESELFTT